MILKESTLAALENAPKREKKANKEWMTEEILELMTKRKAAKNTPRYHIIDNEINVKIKAAKENYYSGLCKTIEDENKRNQSRNMHDNIKTVTGKRKKKVTTGCIKSKKGDLLFEKEDIKTRWAEYISDLFDDERPATPSPGNLNGPPILRSEVEKAIKDAPIGKAPGEDGISAEAIKLLEDFGTEKLTELFNEVYDSGHIPDDLLKSVYTTLPKKPKATKCEEHRTISLMPHVMKIFLKIILERNKERINVEIGDEQFGFRPGSGTREGIFCINGIVQKYINVNKELYTCFIDYSKAFDRIHHQQLIDCLEKIGMDGKDIRIIANLYWMQKAAIRVGDELSDYTEIKRGVRQGCVLSPYLFNIYTEFIFRENSDSQGAIIGGCNISNLRYADDTMLLSEDKEELTTMIKNVKNSSRILDLI